MKKSILSFTDGFLGLESKAAKGKPQMKFDWDKAAEIIKNKLKDFPNLIAEAGLQGDWNYTGGIIFEDGKHTNENYTFLSSNWAKPTLIISSGGDEIDEIECFTIDLNSRFNESSKWDEISLDILNS